MNNKDNSNLPLVSVVIPSYNHSLYIQQCIESVINQSYKNIELIVIDDASKDNSSVLLKELQKQYGFILVCRKENKGVSATLNEGIFNYTHGKYVRCLASDDYWPETSVSDTVDYMEEHPETSLVFGWGYGVNSEGKVLGTVSRIEQEEIINFENLFTDNFILAPTTMFTKAVFMEQGGFDNNTIIEDWDLWLRIFFYDYIVGYFKQRSLAFYREHENNTFSKVEIMTCAREHIFRTWKNKIPSCQYNRIWSAYVCRYFRIFSGNRKKIALKLLSQYQFKYVDISIVKNLMKGIVKLFFYWK